MTRPFYREPPEPCLRLGDVLSGYVLSYPKQADALSDCSAPSLSINLSIPQFCVLLTPCCSVGKGRKMLTVSPLRPVKASWFLVPYLAEDLTRLNCRAMPAQLMLQESWDKLTEEEREEKLQGPLSYGYLEYFVFAEHVDLPQYEVKLKDQTIYTRYHMIDFRDTYVVDCEKFKVVDGELEFPLRSKRLQLSARARTELRLKLASFYVRPAKEDFAEDPAVATLIKEANVR